jgi:hypothetical protein
MQQFKHQPAHSLLGKLSAFENKVRQIRIGVNMLKSNTVFINQTAIFG